MAKPRPLDQQVVVITGASSGIGREAALQLAARGARVVVSARRDEALDDLVNEIEVAGGQAKAVPCDVSIMEEVQALATETLAAYGRIDTWVNNAAVLVVGEFDKITEEEARRLFDVNFWGQVHGCRAVLPIMREQDYGTIINTTSVTARRALPLMSYYSASKAALNGLYEALRAELHDTNINISIIMPATIDTPLYQNARSKEGRMSRPGAVPMYPPSEVAKAIVSCAENPKRVMYAGPAGLFLAVSNSLMPGVLDKILGTVGRPALLSEYPEAPGHDNLYSPLPDAPTTPSGGWRGTRYRVGDTIARIGLGIAAIFLVRRLVKR
jgi:NAD(P)-dependent dehydrogenase (short-subunit alcohol dehydrogenase family)